MNVDKDRCNFCPLKKQGCYNLLFRAYYKANLYPTAMICDYAEILFIQNDVQQDKVCIPPRCQHDTMGDFFNYIQGRHNETVTGYSDQSTITQFNDSAMDYDWNNPDKV